jgi:hypothetical protein
MRHLRLRTVAVGLVLGSGFVLGACSSDFDSPFAGTCTTTMTAAESQAGDPAGSSRYVVNASCNTGVTFGTLAGTSDVLAELGAYHVDTLGVRDSVDLTITATTEYVDSHGNKLQSTYKGTGFEGVEPEEGTPLDVTFSGTETYTGGGPQIFPPGTGSSKGSATMDLTTGKGTYEFNGTLTITSYFAY